MTIILKILVDVISKLMFLPKVCEMLLGKSNTLDENSTPKKL